MFWLIYVHKVLHLIKVHSIPIFTPLDTELKEPIGEMTTYRQRDRKIYYFFDPYKNNNNIKYI